MAFMKETAHTYTAPEGGLLHGLFTMKVLESALTRYMGGEGGFLHVNY